MKLFLIALALTIPLAAWSVTTQAQKLGVISASIKSQTVAQITTSTSTAVGELVFCTNCGSAGGAGTICVSTGAATAGAFVLSTGTTCK